MQSGAGAWAVEVLSEDDHLIAVVKPPGLPTANAPAGRPSLYGWLKERLGPDRFVGIVSRLDAPVSGVVVVAKTPAAAACLAAEFRDRTVHKIYLAVVAGRFPAPLAAWVEWQDRLVRGEGARPSTIALTDVPTPTDADRLERGGAESQNAVCRARVVRRAGEVSLVELEPRTGRRHQLRAQLAARGCPIVGDRLYGSRLPFAVPGGIALHAAGLTIADPGGGPARTFTAPAGAEWRRSFPALFSRSGGE